MNETKKPYYLRQIEINQSHKVIQDRIDRRSFFGLIAGLSIMAISGIQLLREYNSEKDRLDRNLTVQSYKRAAESLGILQDITSVFEDKKLPYHSEELKEPTEKLFANGGEIIERSYDAINILVNEMDGMQKRNPVEVQYVIDGSVPFDKKYIIGVSVGATLAFGAIGASLIATKRNRSNERKKLEKLASGEDIENASSGDGQGENTRTRVQHVTYKVYDPN